MSMIGALGHLGETRTLLRSGVGAIKCSPYRFQEAVGAALDCTHFSNERYLHVLQNNVFCRLLNIITVVCTSRYTTEGLSFR